MKQVLKSNRRPIARFERKGSRLVIKRVSRRIRCIVENQLTYNYVVQLRGRAARAAGRVVEVIPTECFELVIDEDNVQPPQLITAAGYYPKLRAALEDHGYKVLFTDNTSTRVKAQEAMWDRIGNIELRWKQDEVLRQIINNPCGRIQCPTGYGKSWLIAALCRIYPRARIDVTTHSNDVIDMLYGDLSSKLPSVGLVTGKSKKQGERVMCYSGKSLHHADFDADFLFVDEVHEFATADYLGRVAKYKHARHYGFSANKPGDRNDGADFELEGAFGPVLIEIPYEDAVAHDCIVQVKVRFVDVVMDMNPCDGSEDPVARQRWGFWRNRTRNELIAEISREYEDEQVLIVVDTVEHACFLKKLLPEFTLVHGEDGLDEERFERFVSWGLLNNDEPVMTTKRRFALKRQFETGELRKVIATTVWNRGVNFRKLQVLVRADGKSSPIADAQIPGRLSRLSENKNYGLLVDFNDQFDPTMMRRASERKSRYRKMKWDILEPQLKGTRYAQGRLFTE